VNSLPKTVTCQCRGYDLNPGPSAPESSTLTTRLPSHPLNSILMIFCIVCYNRWAMQHGKIIMHEIRFDTTRDAILTCAQKPT